LAVLIRPKSLRIAGSSGTNPTLSANPRSFVSNNLAGVVGSRRAMRLFFAVNSASNLLKIQRRSSHGCCKLPVTSIVCDCGRRAPSVMRLAIERRRAKADRAPYSRWSCPDNHAKPWHLCVRGARISVYEIPALIGEGGMGQVYRATDTMLGPQVAIKILPEHSPRTLTA
jgi:hypothetical protein